jgi:uncharacterized membrane protein
MKRRIANTLDNLANNCFLLGIVFCIQFLLFYFGYTANNQDDNFRRVSFIILGIGLFLLILGVIIYYILFKSKIN